MRFSSMNHAENPVLVNELHVLASNTVHNLDSYVQNVMFDGAWSKVYNWYERLKQIHSQNDYLEFYNEFGSSGGGFPFDRMI